MAESKIGQVIRKQKVEVEIDVPETVVELTLTLREAKALMVALSGVGGSPETTARKYTDPIVKALDNAGYAWTGFDNHRGEIDYGYVAQGSITLTPYSKDFVEGL